MPDSTAGKACLAPTSHPFDSAQSIWVGLSVLSPCGLQRLLHQTFNVRLRVRADETPDRLTILEQD